MTELSSREVTQRKIADALDYLGENYNIVDKAVREGKATNMDIARGFTGDVKSDKFVENIGLLDFTPAGTYFAFEEGEKAIMEAEPDAFKRSMAVLSALRKPLQTAIDRPEIGMPAIEMMASVIEAVPFVAVATKPIKNFFKSLKAKATEPLDDVGINIQKNTLPSVSDDNTTTKLAENQGFDPSRRKFVKDIGTLGALGAISTQVPDTIKMVSKASKKIKPKITFTSAQKAFIRPQLVNYLEEMSDSEMGLADTVTDLLFDRVPAYRNMKVREIDEQGKFGKQYIKETYGIDDLNELSLEEIMDNEKLVDDLSIDVAGDNEFEFRYAVQQKALKDGAKIDEDNLLSEPAMDLYTDDKIVNETNKAVTDYYNTLKEEGKSANDIALFMREKNYDLINQLTN